MLLFKCNIFRKFLFFVLIGLVCAHLKISDKRLCVDDKCEVPISEGRTLLRYSSPSKNILSCGPNDQVTIFSKSAGSNPTLWGVEINGKRGYIPSQNIREKKVFRIPEKLVDTELVSDSPTIEVPSQDPKQTKTDVNPEPVKQPYQVIDGTKVLVDEDIDSFSQENIVDKSNDVNTNSVGTDKKEKSLENEPKDSKHDSILNDEKHTNDILGGLISNAVTYLTGIDDKDKKHLDVTVNNEKEEENNVDEEDDDEDDDDDGSDDDGDDSDENEDGDTEKDDEEIENKDSIPNTNSEAKPKSEISNEKSLSSGGRHLLQFSEKTKNSVAENLQTIITQKNNTEAVANPILEPNKGKIEKLADDLSNDNNFAEANANPFNFNNKEQLSKEQKANENKDKTLEIVEDKEQHQEKIKQQVKGVIDLKKISEFDVTNNSVEKKNSEKKLNSKEDTKVENTKIKSDVDSISVNEENSEEKLLLQLQTNTNLEKLPLIENFYSKNETAEIEPNNLDEEPVQQFNNSLYDNEVNETFEIVIQKDDSGENYKLKENVETETFINENSNIDVQNISDASTQHIQDNLTQNSQENLTQNMKDLTQDIKEDVTLNVQNDLTQNIKEDLTQDVKEDVTQDVNEDVTLNVQNDVTQNIQEDSLQNFNEKSSEKILASNSNNNYVNVEINDPLKSQTSDLNGNSIYKNLKSESNNIPESFIIHSEDEEQSQNKISNGIYQTLHESSLLIHKNKDKQLSNSKASSTIQPELGNEYCLKSENAEDCALDKRDSAHGNDFFHETIMEFLFNLPNDVVSTVLITALTTILFLLGYIYIDKSNRIRPLIAKINKLEKELLLTEEEKKISKEKLLEEQNEINDKVNDVISSEVLETLQQQLEDALNAKTALEEQIVNLERELENSTEVGLELNRMLSDFLSSQDSDVLVANIEQLQRQLVEQQGTINSYSETLNVKETEIHELRLELEISNSKVTDLQKENERATASLLKIEEEKYELQNKLESEINVLKKHIEQLTISSTAQLNKLSDELKVVQKKSEESQRNAELKTKEYNLLKENTLKLKTLKDEDINSLLDVTTFKAELELLSKEKHLLLEHCKESDKVKNSIQEQYQKVVNEMQTLQRRYDEADREKLEAQTKLEVLENYFKERETNLQKELAKHEAMFTQKQGETYSITEKIKFMQEELQNYKAQNESLKQEIMEQEVQMKSQISLLEKRVHENWVNARQAERKLEEAKQEAAQLRNRLTIRERTLHEEKYQNRLKSPSEQNGELPVSPTPASPPLIFGTRDITTSPPLQGLPPPFLPPPPFMPPPIHGGVPPPFMPPPSSMPPLQAMFPSDRRPAPLGRMSSPPIDSRYSPDSRAYSPYSRNSPSPTSDDDYCHSPPPLHRGYSPINNRDSKREYRRSPGASKISRNHKGSMHSSGSANSNESLEKIPRKPSKV